MIESFSIVPRAGFRLLLRRTIAAEVHRRNVAGPHDDDYSQNDSDALSPPMTPRVEFPS